MKHWKSSSLNGAKIISVTDFSLITSELSDGPEKLARFVLAKIISMTAELLRNERLEKVELLRKLEAEKLELLRNARLEKEKNWNC